MKEWLPRGIIHGTDNSLRKEPQVKETTKKRKKAKLGIETAYGKQWVVDQMFGIYEKGKQGFDTMMKEMGRMMAETIMYIDREEIAG